LEENLLLFPTDVGLACDQLMPVMRKTMGWKGQLVNPVVDPSDEYVLHDDVTVGFLSVL
jgi:hypothetical protein